jgi:ankyrin repeat protein
MDSNSLCFITQQEIFNVVRSGNLEGLKELLKHVNKGESSNGSSSSSSSSISEFMFMQNDAGETLLYIAAENGVKDLFCFLLSFCDLEILKIRSKSDMNAFHVAAKRGHLGIFFFFHSFLVL